MIQDDAQYIQIRHDSFWKNVARSPEVICRGMKRFERYVMILKHPLSDFSDVNDIQSLVWGSKETLELAMDIHVARTDWRVVRTRKFKFILEVTLYGYVQTTG